MTSAIREQGYLAAVGRDAGGDVHPADVQPGFAPLLPSLQSESGMSFTQLGLFTGIYGLLAIALSVPAGVAAKHFGEKTRWPVGSRGRPRQRAAQHRDDFSEALAWRIVTITGYRFAFVCVLVAIAVTAPPSLRGRAMGLTGAMSALASVIGAPLVATWCEGSAGVRGFSATQPPRPIGSLIFAIVYRRRPDRRGRGARSVHSRVSRARNGRRERLQDARRLDAGADGRAGRLRPVHRDLFRPVDWALPLRSRCGCHGLDHQRGYMCAIVVNLLVGVLMDRL